MRWDWLIISIVIFGIGAIITRYTLNKCDPITIPEGVDDATALMLRVLAKLECSSGDMKSIVLNILGYTGLALGATYFGKSLLTIFKD